VNALVAMLCGFIAENFPDIQVMIFAGVPSLIWGAACLWVAGALKPFRLTARTIFPSACPKRARIRFVRGLIPDGVGIVKVVGKPVCLLHLWWMG